MHMSMGSVWREMKVVFKTVSVFKWNIQIAWIGVRRREFHTLTKKVGTFVQMRDFLSISEVHTAKILVIGIELVEYFT